MTHSPTRARDIFLEALDKSDGVERQAYLARICEGNNELRHQVEQLLAAHQQSRAFLDRGALAPGPTEGLPSRERPGHLIGNYKLLQQIGEGGMGVVYMAEQLKPVQRRVALKIIKPGMDSRQVIARFEAERQALALMDHPNIAKVLDAGTTGPPDEDAGLGVGQTSSFNLGRPYFVMELVKGIPITRYCDEQHLTPRERLELFLPVCQAVQHAHQKGIIHRDLKPSNILMALVDGQPVPKIIDFGVAKATHQRLTEKTMFTEFGQIVGTLEYMSPEQARLDQLDIDTRSDIYSLGVVLYELLTGATPFDRQRLRSAAFDELLRIIREEDPPRPSTRLSTVETLPSVAANRRIEPKKLGVLLSGELDWIVMKALDKDRARRYSTATDLAADLHRYLHDEPVVACPPSAAYRFRKFARRNKAALATAVAIGLALFAGIVGTSWQAFRATREANRALTAEGLAEQRYTTEREARQDADRARQAESTQRQLAQQKSREAQQSAAEAVDQGKKASEARDRAEANFAQARRAVNDYFVQVSEDPALAAPDLTDLRHGLLRSALTFYEEFLKERADDDSLRLELAQTHLKVAQIRFDLGQKKDGTDALRDALRRFQELLADSPRDLEARIGEAACLDKLVQFTDAIARWETLRAEHPDDERILQAAAKTYNRHGVVLNLNSKPREALAAHEQSREIRERLLARDPNNAARLDELGQTLNNLAAIAVRDPARGDDVTKLYGGAREYLERAHRLSPGDYQIAHSTAVACNNHGRQLENSGHHAEAADAYRRSAEILQSLVARHPTLRDIREQMVERHRQMARSFVRIGRTRDAALVMRRLREAIASLPADSATELLAIAQMRALGSISLDDDGDAKAGLTAEEREDEARFAVDALETAILRGFRNVSFLHTDPAMDSLRQRKDFQNLLLHLEQLVKLDELRKKPLAEQAVELEKVGDTLASLAADKPQFAGFQAGVAQTYYALGAAKLGLGDKAAAEIQFDKARAILEPIVRRQNAPDHLVMLAMARRRLGALWWEKQRYVEAKNLWNETRRLLDEGLAKHPDQTAIKDALTVHEVELAIHFAEYGHWSLAHEHWKAGRQFGLRIQSAMWDGRISSLDALFDAPDEFAASCQQLISRTEKSFDPHVAWAAALRPDSGLTADRWQQLAQDAEKVHLDFGRGVRSRFQLWTGDIESALPRLADYLAVVGHAKLGKMPEAKAKFQSEERAYKNAWTSWLKDRQDGGLRKFTDAYFARNWTDPKTNAWWWAVGLTVARRFAWPLVEGRPAADPWRHLLESKIWERMGEPERAAESFRQAVEATPTDPEAWLARALYCESIGRQDQANSDLRKAVELSADSVQYRIELAMYYDRQGQQELAESTLREAGSDPAALAARGKLELLHGRPAQAVEPLAKLAKDRQETLGPSDPATRSGMFALARAHFEAGQWNEACLIYEELLDHGARQLGPDSKESSVVRHILASLYQSFASQLDSELQKNPEQALAIARRMSRVDSRHFAVFPAYNLGAVLCRQGDHAEALEHLNSARWGGGLTAGSHLFEAIAFWKLGKADDARHRYAHAVSQILAQPPAAAYTAHLDEVRKLLDLKPDHDFEVVMQVLDRAIINAPSKQFLWLRRGAVRFKLRQFADALADFQRAAELTPSDAYAWAGQVRALHALERDGEIRTLLQDAVAKMTANLSSDPSSFTKSYDHAWYVARCVPEIWKTVDETAAFLDELPGEAMRNLDFERRYITAAWLLREGDRAGYERSCRQAAEQRDPTNMRHTHIMARMAALSPETPLAASEIVDAARQAAERVPLSYNQHGLALALLRDGQFHAAIEQAQFAAEDGYFPPMNWMVQALAHHHLGQPDVAKRIADRCRIWPTSAAEIGALHPHDRLGAELLHREVERLIVDK
ncbi:MAG: protein kinase [Pirellulales bacterium]